MFILAIFISYLALSLLGGGPYWFSRERGVEVGKADRGGSAGVHHCPICGHILQKGQRVKSIVFQGGTETGGVKEQVSHLLGCPYCFPPNRENPRKCPVCEATLPNEGYLIARFFTRKGKRRKHVHVLGCTECRKQMKKPVSQNIRIV